MCVCVCVCVYVRKRETGEERFGNDPRHVVQCCIFLPAATLTSR